MRVPVTIVLCGLLGLPAAQAAEIRLDLQIPQMTVAEYHRPYVAIWVEGKNSQALANLAVWYQLTTNSEGAGTKWLPDLRQWWRRSGRSLTVPIDGVTGPTKPAGRHAVRFDHTHPSLKSLPAGQYTLVVEAVREVGGREMVKIPFQWRGASQGSAQGTTELGRVALTTTR